MFQEKTQEELAKMDATTLAAYFKEKSVADAAKIAEMIAEKASKSEIEAIKDALKAQGLEISKIASGNGGTKEKTLREHLEAKSADLKALREGSTKRVMFELNTKTMSIADNFSGNLPTQYEPGVNMIQRRRPFAEDYLLRATTASGRVAWFEQQNPSGGPAFIAEGVLKPTGSFDLVEVAESPKKIAEIIPITEEYLDDMPMLMSVVQNELVTLINIEKDRQILVGDGIGANLNGLITQATAFAAGIFAGTIVDPNNYDVLRIAYNQVVLANFMPTTIFLHPSDMTMMQITKGTDGHYIEFPFVDESGTRMLGSVQIVANTGVPQDSFLIFDGSKATVWSRKGMSIEIGYGTGDFERNRLSVRGEERLFLQVKGNDTLAFVTGEFSTAKAALQVP